MIAPEIIQRERAEAIAADLNVEVEDMANGDFLIQREVGDDDEPLLMARFVVTRSGAVEVEAQFHEASACDCTILARSLRETMDSWARAMHGETV